MTADPALIIVGELAIAWLFAHAAWHKLQAPGNFSATLASYRLLPAAIVKPAAALLVAMEIGSAIGAALGMAPALLAAAGLLGLYATAMAVNLHGDRELLDCGCGGPAQPVSWWLVARNLVLSTIALMALLPSTGRVLGPLDAIAIGGALLVLATTYVAANAVHAARVELDEWV